MMKKTAMFLASAALILAGSAATAATERPTVVLVHGAFADASSWNGVIRILEADGFKVIAAANPLRTVSGDADYVGRIVEDVKSPVVLVGHSYGGMVISAAAQGHANVHSLVFVAAFAPEAGESALALTGKFPGGTLGPTLAPPVVLADGGKDLYIQQDKFPSQFAADVPAGEAKLMAATQRPVAEAALSEPSPEPAWKTVPSWFVFGDQDKNIPPQAMAFMADRAHSKKTAVVKGASHVVMVSQPKAVAEVIERAALASGG